MNYWFETDKGRKRKLNEDNCAVFEPQPDACVAVVCDGMGGANAGDVASAIAVDTLISRIKAGWRPDITEESLKNLLLTSLSAANINVYDQSLSSPELDGMGTTAVVCGVCGSRAVIAHVGDSRAYLCGDKLTQLTNDHSVVQELLDQGKITPAQAKVHPKKHYITRALGVDEMVDIDFNALTLGGNDALILCSDGLTNFVSEEDIFRIVSDDRRLAAERLVEKANENGGGDNITVVVISAA